MVSTLRVWEALRRSNLWAAPETKPCTSTAVNVDWAFTGNQISGSSATWTPDGSTTYDITLTAGGQTATITTSATTASVSRTDTLTFGSNIEASAVATAKVTFKEN